MYILYIQPENEEAEKFYKAAADAYLAKPYEQRDAGFDLFCTSNKVAGKSLGTRLSQQTKAAFYDSGRKMFNAYWLLPRSSISKTGLRLANSVGLIDAGYRGTLLAVVDNHADEEKTISNGDRYFQVAAPTLQPWDQIHIVSEIPGGETLRGAGGFGSTGRSGVESRPVQHSASTGGLLNYFV